MAITRTTEQLKDIIQWDIKSWTPCLNYWDENSNIPANSKILAIGEREGGLSLHFALEGHSVICSDYNPLPAHTKEMHERYNVSNRISYASIDMKAIDMPDNSVDVVVFKSVIGALGNASDQQQAMHEIYRVLKPGGTFLFAENLTGSAIHRYLRKKFVKWGERWRYITKDEMLNWGDKYKTKTTKSTGVSALFGRTEGQRNLLAGFDKVSTPVTPKKWRYIIFGVFKK